MVDKITNVLSKLPALLRVAISGVRTVISAFEQVIGFLIKFAEFLENLLRKAEDFLLKQGDKNVV